MYVQNNNYQEKCRSFMIDKDLQFDGEFIADGNIHRYSSDGNPRKKNEWYASYQGVLPTGHEYFNVVFGSWQTGGKYVFCSFKEDTGLPPEVIKELKEIWRCNKMDADHKIQEERDKAAFAAQKMLDGYSITPMTTEHSRYERSKEIKHYDGVRYGTKPQNQQPFMAIPLFNMQGQLRSLQYIYYEQDQCIKRFLPNGEKKGNFYIFGKITDETSSIIMGEGYSTCASIFEAVNLPTVVCFDAGNIVSVVEAFRNKYPTKKIIIAGDADEAGRKHAEIAAIKFECVVVYPVFTKQYDPKKHTDFNDLHVICGLQDVQDQLRQAEQQAVVTDQKDSVEKFLDNKIIEPCEFFRVEALPPILREYIASLCMTTNAHSVMITASVLSMTAGFLGTKVYIPEGEDGYFQNLYTNLWILSIAGSGEFKTTALNKGAKIAFAEQARIIEKMKTMRRENPDIDKHQLLELSCMNPILPTKTTVEAFLEDLSQGYQGCIFSSEFGAWLQNLDKLHNSDFKAILTDFYDVPKAYRYKTKTSGDFTITRPFISICAVSTMAWLGSNIKTTDIASGFFARFLIFTPPIQDYIPAALPKKKMYESRDKEEQFEQYFKQALEKIGKERIYSLSEAARAKFEELHAKMHGLFKDYDDEQLQATLKIYVQRWSPYLLKIAMIMQIFIDADSEVIDDVAIICAYNFLEPAIKSTELLFKQELGLSEHQGKCDKVYRWMHARIKKTNKPIQRASIMQSKQLKNGSKEYESILQTLEEEDKILCTSFGSSKKDRMYSLVEKVENN